MSMKDLLDKYALNRVDFNELGDEIIATVQSWRMDKDKRGKDALFLVVDVQGKGVMTFKYGRMFMRQLLEAFMKMGYMDLNALIGLTFRWKREKFITNFGATARYFPVSKVD